MLSQAALEIYLKSGMFEKHKQKIRSSYQKRSCLLHDLLKECAASLGDVLEFHPHGHPAIHTHIELDRTIPASRLIKSLQKRNVLLEPVNAHYMSAFPKRNLLKINTSNVKEDDIRRGIDRLRQAVETAYF